jgi:hypothetical protein
MSFSKSVHCLHVFIADSAKGGRGGIGNFRCQGRKAQTFPTPEAQPGSNQRREPSAVGFRCTGGDVSL